MKANPSAVFIFPSGEEQVRNADVAHPFRQESNLHYLSGFEEPESVLVLAPSTTQPGSHRFVLFVRRRDPERELWEGARYGVEGACSVFGAHEAFPIDEFDQRLPELLQGAEKVFYRLGRSAKSDERILKALEATRRALGRSGRGLLPIHDPGDPLGEMRLFKGEEEVALLRKASQITALAHKTAMIESRPGMNEFEIEALIDYAFRRNGCQRMGYGSIVAGGKNATCLHYTSNNEPLRDGELLLIDAGGEYGYYTSDISRTFPVGKRFSAPQAALYDLVLRSQKEAIEMSRPGVTLPAIHAHVCEVLVDGLLSLGLLAGQREELIKSGGHRRFFPHNTSHWLGMDVHDVGLYQQNGEPRALEPGMVFTIEPGLYVQPNDSAAPVEYRNIGIRIEDDILITATGCENLTKDAPKERSEIEALKG
ncbi:MAG: aminopeptidase P N-terminal domain-containing protein [Oligoflexia bacterium]|nr:aminopeptidase P N-terminal domain-containing protein [Oligoflexia bacterium]